MKIIIDGTEYDDRNDAIEAVLDNIDESAFDEELDEGEEINVWGNIFSPSYVLKECDPIAYQCGFNDFKDGLREEVEDAFDKERDTELFDSSIEFIDSEEDEEDDPA